MRKKRNLKRWYRNRVTKSSIKTAIGGVNEAISGNDADTVKATLLKAIRQIDKAVSKGVLHKNTAARKKSRLTRKLNLSLAKSDNQ